MKIRTKVTVVFLFVILLIWVTVLFAQNTYTVIHQEFELLEEDIIPGAIAMSEMENTANEASHEVMDYVVFGEEESKQIVLSATKDLEELGLEHLEHETHIGQEEQKVAEELLVKINVFNSAVAELIDMKEQGVSVDEILERENETIHPSLDSLITQLEEHKATHMEEFAAAEEAVYEAHISGVQVLFLVAGLITLLAVAVLWFISGSIVKPIHALHRGTEIIGEGNLDYKVGTKAKDEIGQLTRAFDQMTENLKSTTTSIDNLNKEISERKRSEKTLQESEEKYRGLVSNVKLGIFRSTPGPSGRFLEANPAMEEITGYSREELLQMNVSDLYVHPEERETVLKEIASTIGKTGRELRFRKKDGTEIVVSDTRIAIRDSGGNILYFDGIMEDITEHKRMEQELQKRNEQLDAHNEELRAQS